MTPNQTVVIIIHAALVTIAIAALVVLTVTGHVTGATTASMIGVLLGSSGAVGAAVVLGGGSPTTATSQPTAPTTQAPSITPTT